MTTTPIKHSTKTEISKTKMTMIINMTMKMDLKNMTRVSSNSNMLMMTSSHIFVEVVASFTPKDTAALIVRNVSTVDGLVISPVFVDNRRIRKISISTLPA